MGTLLASDVINRVGTALGDTNNAKWSPSELLGYLNDGERLIATLQPISAQEIAAAPLVAGARQALPRNGWMLIDIVRNLGSSGASPGRAIRIIGRRLLDAFNPLWQTALQSPVVQSYIYDLRDPLNFFVYPPSTGGVYVEINYALTIAPLISANQPITLIDIYEEALYTYMLFRAASKLAEYAPGPEVASGYWTLFQALLTGREKAEMQINPNASLLPPMPTEAGET
jgi:hypothetical protein